MLDEIEKLRKNVQEDQDDTTSNLTSIPSAYDADGKNETEAYTTDYSVDANDEDSPPSPDLVLLIYDAFSDFKMVKICHA